MSYTIGLDFGSDSVRALINSGCIRRTISTPRHEKEEDGAKVIYSGAHKTPWRVIILADSPGKLIEPEIIQNLNDPCAIEDPSLIQPGLIQKHFL